MCLSYTSPYKIPYCIPYKFFTFFFNKLLITRINIVNGNIMLIHKKKITKHKLFFLKLYAYLPCITDS